MRNEIAHRAVADAHDVATRVRMAGKTEQGAAFHAALKNSEILPLATRLADDPPLLLRTAFDCLYVLGHVALPITVGLTMHQYITATLTTAPVTDGETRRKRNDLAERLLAERLLAAVASVDQTVDRDGTVRSSVTATYRSGRFILNGVKRYTSFASYADVLFFTAAVEGRGFGLFVAPLKNNLHIRIGPTIAPGFMSETDTRSLTFESLELAESQALSVGPADDSDAKHAYSIAWFEALVSAPYLGAAHEALRRAAAVARGTLGSSSDARELGRLGLQLSQGLQLSYGPQAALSELSVDPAGAIRKFSRAAQVCKYHGTRLAQEIVTQVRERMGVRGMVGEGELSTVSDGIIFGPLHPRPNAQIEAQLGAELLSEGEAPRLG